METTIKSTEALFYIIAWVVAAMAGVSRQLSVVDNLTCRHVIAVGLNSGFLGFSVVALYIRLAGGFAGTEFYYLGIAALIGLAGKEQEQIVSLMWAKLMDRPRDANDGK